jgi:hypothetical protein
VVVVEECTVAAFETFSSTRGAGPEWRWLSYSLSLSSYGEEAPWEASIVLRLESNSARFPMSGRSDDESTLYDYYYC